jgi:hypothetical protein
MTEDVRWFTNDLRHVDKVLFDCEENGRLFVIGGG